MELYRQLKGIMSGCIELRMNIWSQEWLYGTQNGFMKLQMVSWSSKWLHEAANAAWNSKRLHRAMSVSIQQYCSDEWYINWRDKSKKVPTVEKVSVLQDANCLCETNKRGGNCTAHLCVYVCICIKMIVMIKKA